MTRDEILNLPAGREMDEMIAVHVFGLAPDMTHDGNPCAYCGSEMWNGKDRSRCSICGEWRHSAYKKYSTDISDAWEVVEKVGKPYSLIAAASGSGEVSCEFLMDIKEDYETVEAHAETAPLAICRAALIMVLNK